MKRKIYIHNEIMTSSSPTEKWERTNLRLNSHAGASSDSKRASAAVSIDEDCCYLCLPSSSDVDSRALHMNGKNDVDDENQSSKATRLRHLMTLDQYLSTVPQLASATRQLFSSSAAVTNSNPNKHKLITSTNSGRIINVLQGEIAHCTNTQADVLVSDDATTCHILGLWSRRQLCYTLTTLNTAHPMMMMQQPARGDMGGNDDTLATVAHIDSPDYDSCIKNAIDLHYQYHSSQLLSTGDDETNLSFIELTIHIMGGYNDNDGTSLEITNTVMRALSNESNEYVDRQPEMRMILRTCAVSSSNDNGSGCPIGRGLALQVSSGEVYLAEVSEHIDTSSIEYNTSNATSATTIDVTTSARGPDCILRSARLWASFMFNHNNSKRTLEVIHHPNNEYLHISPFFFTWHSFPQRMLALDDDLLLEYTSSSPDVEKDNFARHVRATFRYMNGTYCFHVFKRRMDENDDDSVEDSWSDEDYLPRRYRRVGLNGWTVVGD